MSYLLSSAMHLDVQKRQLVRQPDEGESLMDDFTHTSHIRTTAKYIAFAPSKYSPNGVKGATAFSSTTACLEGDRFFFFMTHKVIRINTLSSQRLERS